MSTSVTLPALGESVTEGTVSRWLKSVGDTVEVDEPLLEVSTDKVDTEIPSPVAGVLLEIKAEEDETIEVGAVLAVVGAASEQTAAESPGGADAEPAAEPEPEPETPEPEQAPEPQQAPEPARSDSTPPPKKASGGGSGHGTEVKLPALGESVTEGTVSRWLKQVGDEVAVDEALVEISTDKVDTEVPSPVAGTVLELKVDEDETVEIGGVLAIVGDRGAGAGADTAPSSEPASARAGDAQSVEEPEDAVEAGDEGGQEPIPAPEPERSEPPAAKPEEAPRPTPKPAPPAPAAQNTVAPRSAGAGAGAGAYVTPLVRKLANEHAIDLATVQGTGVGGRIRKQDVLAAVEAAKQTSAAQAASAAPAQRSRVKEPSAEALAKRGTTEKLTRTRLTIARRMQESLQSSAQLTATVEVDLTRISRLRAAVKADFRARHGVGLSYLPFIAIATVEALRLYPQLNATVDTEAKTVSYADAEHLGIAVDTDRGLMVPVVHNAGDLNLAGLAKRIAEQADKSRTGSVLPDDLVGGTFTITNYGSAGTLFDTPILNLPQVAILGTGALVKRPMVVSDEALGEVIAIRDMMYLSLTYDHRLVDGADAARFLSAVKERLEAGDFGTEPAL